MRPSKSLGTLALAALLASCIQATPSVAPVLPAPRSAAAAFKRAPSCLWSWSHPAAADALLRNRYVFSPHPAATLPTDLTWREDPFHDEDWLLQFQSLRWADALLAAWEQTHQRRYLTRYETILRDWLATNGSPARAIPGAWDDHSTAWRSMTLACGYETLHASWLRDALIAHGRTLAQPGFYVGHSNHALNQDLGLLAAGCALHNEPWKKLAARRIDALARESIDPQGATNEQSVGYEAYNYGRYTEAVTRLQRCHLVVPATLRTRLALMPRFLAQATMPNGRYVPIGDSEARLADAISGTEAAFAATRGRIGIRPAAESAVYDAGYAFGRIGWGETRRFTDEVFYSMRFGPGRAIHGHSDGTAVTLYGYGASLLLDPGKYSYDNNVWRRYFQGPSAHNLITIDGASFDRHAGTELVASETTDAYDFIAVRTRAWLGAVVERRMIFSRATGAMVIEDLVHATRPVVARQLWHLSSDAEPLVRGATVQTRRARGNLAMTWLGQTPALDVVRGRTAPIQGWVSNAWRQRTAAPVVEATERGRTIRFVTVLVASPRAQGIKIGHIHLAPGAIRLNITIGDETQRFSIAAQRGELFDLKSHGGFRAA